MKSQPMQCRHLKHDYSPSPNEVSHEKQQFSLRDSSSATCCWTNRIQNILLKVCECSFSVVSLAACV